MESVLGGGGEGEGDSHNGNDGTGNNNSGSRRMSAGDIFGRVHPIYKLHGDVPHHKRASTLCAFGNRGRQLAILLVQVGVPSEPLGDVISRGAA
jgi:hypothetical protein